MFVSKKAFSKSYARAGLSRCTLYRAQLPTSLSAEGEDKVNIAIHSRRP